MTDTTPSTGTTSGAKAYAVAYLREVDLGEEIVAYLRAIDLTLAPYGGRFLVHGGHLDPVEGEWDGDLVIIEFPDRATARAWYDSPDYQAILPLRTEHSESIAAIAQGVAPGHTALDTLSELLAAGA